MFKLVVLWQYSYCQITVLTNIDVQNFKIQRSECELSRNLQANDFAIAFDLQVYISFEKDNNIKLA